MKSLFSLTIRIHSIFPFLSLLKAAILTVIFKTNTKISISHTWFGRNIFIAGYNEFISWVILRYLENSSSQLWLNGYLSKTNTWWLCQLFFNNILKRYNVRRMFQNLNSIQIIYYRYVTRQPTRFFWRMFSSQLLILQSVRLLEWVHFFFVFTLWASLNALHPALQTCTKDARNDSGYCIYLKPSLGSRIFKEKSFSVDINISWPRRAMHIGAGVRKSAQFILEDIINEAVSSLSSPELASIKALLILLTILSSLVSALAIFFLEQETHTNVL